jgi:2-polyprenyl-3-methyl-5-hydroxy-6-metoxy-1,4-benzoquinol methylase
MQIRYLMNRFLYSCRDVARSIHPIDSIRELDSVFDEVERLFATSHADAMRKLTSIRFRLDMPLDMDPLSREYLQLIENHYKMISGRSSYEAVEAEKNNFSISEAQHRPYPYLTKDPVAIGEQLIAQGGILRAINLPAGSKILEMGAGWGNLTLQLALTGYDVHAVEIDESAIEVLKYRALQNNVSINIHQADMLNFKTSDKFDAVVFFESFHHCPHPMKLLQSIHSLLKPGGMLVLASEPITIFPNPWGLRFDGLSLWSIRKYGWLELGFDVTFFQDMLRKCGFTCSKQQIDNIHITKLLMCRKN